MIYLSSQVSLSGWKLLRKEVCPKFEGDQHQPEQPNSFMCLCIDSFSQVQVEYEDIHNYIYTYVKWTLNIN